MRPDLTRDTGTRPDAFVADRTRVGVGVAFLLGRSAQAPIPYPVREADP